MDELDRLFARTAAVLAKDARLAVPFPAAGVDERLVPYRSTRSHLRVATHQDYEMAVLRLLAGERGYVRIEPDDVREAMQREITTVNPDVTMFRTFPDARVMINRLAAERFLRGEAADAPPVEEEDEPVSWTSENPIPPAPLAAPPGVGGGGAAPHPPPAALPGCAGAAHAGCV